MTNRIVVQVHPIYSTKSEKKGTNTDNFIPLYAILVIKVVTFNFNFIAI